MKAVLHLPVAEQYPSKTATVDSFASKRTSGMSGGLLRSAQILPIHVRAKVFAGHGAFCLALNRRASFSGDRPFPGNPLIYGCRSYLKKSSHRRLTTYGSTGIADGLCIHSSIIRRRLIFVNRNCLTVRYSATEKYYQKN